MARRSLKDDLNDIRSMIKKSKERQGVDTKAEMGSRAMKATGTEQNFMQGGYTTKTKVDGSRFQGAPLSQANLQDYREAQQQPKPQAQVKPKPPRARPMPGREGMMAKAEEERKRRMRGESAVIGG
jgi:hypothetical protein